MRSACKKIKEEGGTEGKKEKEEKIHRRMSPSKFILSKLVIEKDWRFPKKKNKKKKLWDIPREGLRERG